ncbi:uncharacterized protein LOC117342734 [Pecten maximus]|uniref:uncharacterized protein LOC117342734 n=1 Tax=Pecten maximus TaxID=6579 RepID=UPI0014581CD6|nr:uncharacterized protein LOC117342734 [Pecten maximus]
MAAYIVNSDSSSDLFGRIRRFKNSEEERLLKTSLKHIVQNDLPFINLVIDSCNGKRGGLFTEACVELSPYVEDVGVDTEEIGLINMRLLFKLDIFEKFLENGIDSVLNDTDIVTVFLTLLEFLRDRKVHGKAIKEIIKEAPGKTTVMVALAQHLLSQLVPDKEYLVDSTAKQLPKKCPDCNVQIQAGNTSIGSLSTWHGRADILINKTIAVTVVEEDTETGNSSNDSKLRNSSNDTKLRNSLHDTDMENALNDADLGSSSDSINVEPSIKRRKTASNEKTEIFIDVSRGEDILTNLYTLDQIVAETVTNGFAQVNMDNLLSGLFIPTIGCTAGHASIFLYDPENDILLQAGELLQLWHVSPSERLLSVFSIVCLWLFLNFKTFSVKNLKDKVKLDKSRFHEYMKYKLRFYKEIQIGMLSCTSTSPRPLGTLTQDLKMYCTFRKPSEHIR